MTPEQAKRVDEWLTTLTVALDPASPFVGMVDLAPLRDEPPEVLIEVWDRLTPDQKSVLVAETHR